MNKPSGHQSGAAVDVTLLRDGAEGRPAIVLVPREPTGATPSTASPSALPSAAVFVAGGLFLFAIARRWLEEPALAWTALALYLAGDMAKSITGSIISIDGGWTAA